jgi:hypothetical protein
MIQEHSVRKFLFAILSATLFFVPLAAGQTPTLVSGTITDASGVPYSFAKVSAQLIPTTASPTIIVNGIPTQIGGQQNANADANGVFSMNLFCNTAGGGCSVISPSGTQWQFTVNENGAPPPIGTGPQTCTATVTVTGASQSLTASFAACPALGRAAGGTGTINNCLTTPNSNAYYISTGTTIGCDPGITDDGAGDLTLIGQLQASSVATLVGGVATSTVGGCGGVTAGCLTLHQGTFQSLVPTNSIRMEAPTSVTAYTFTWPGLGSTGIPHWTFSSPAVTESIGPIVAADCPTCTQNIANGTAAMGTSAIASGACATVVTVSATGVATTDVIDTSFNGDPTAVTGYGVSATGAVLTIYPYPTTNNVNFKVCNSTPSSITPAALTLNWSVRRP